ncbi:MAG: alanine--tRNA ligase [Gammaproteobacteria bacterium]|nr:alanine--tRNA ligase [Gammaproteobacteria bacterium]
MMTSAEIRQSFIDYFASLQHQVVASSALVPGNDPTLLFTNAGMVQFKDLFLGQEQRSYQRAVSCQRCVRAGGKHNDLENVGYTARHHTFFEMLGNFSFGDYFKRDAIQYAWRFLTEVCQLPAERLWVTVYADDDEAAAIWLNEMGINPQRFTRIGDKPGGSRYESDNFWSMGDTGPCGPCSEIFYDHGEEVAGGPPGSPEADGDRYIEIWNLVFMQYERDANGTMKSLPRPSVDTGMGLERLVAVMQGVHSNYEIDLFARLVTAAAALTGCSDLQNSSLRVIADHIRSCAFLLVDGVIPANDGRGYVLRRIIRRAIRHGHKLGMRQPFFYRMVAPLVAEMGEAYPELAQAEAHVERLLLQEEQRFAETLDLGMQQLEEGLTVLVGDTINGELLFKLYDTYGFPVDLTADIARERGLRIDQAAFEEQMQAQRQRARAASQFAVQGGTLEIDLATPFVGYEQLGGEAEIVALFCDGTAVAALHSGEEAIVVLAQTPFYAESGGQCGDSGTISVANAQFVVTGVQKQGNTILHIGRLLQGSLNRGDTAALQVDRLTRQATAVHHSATHLMHAALRAVLGDHVQQKGSLVGPERLRFDFSHYDAIDAATLQQIEALVNAKIRENESVVTEIMDIDAARESGAMALFGEKYGEKVRVLRMGDFSMELCGGTHVSRCGDIGLFKIISEAGVAAGVRRIEGVAGAQALIWVQQQQTNLEAIAALLKVSTAGISDRVEKLLQQQRQQQRELEQFKQKAASAKGSDLASSAKDIAGIKLVAARLDGADPKGLRDTVDQLKSQLGQAVILLAAVNDGKIALVAGVTKNETKKLSAGALLQSVAEQIGGKGGGRPDMAQGGGSDPAKLDAALASATTWVKQQLAGSGA